jgi:hypothetical protein
MNDDYVKLYNSWKSDWNRFVRDVLEAKLDNEQKSIVSSVQFNPRTAVSSGTARGKDFVAACACLCFMYLTPKFDSKGNLIENTKIALTAPTGRQVKNIMTPEIRRLLRQAKVLPGRLVSDDIRTEYEEWFLTGFKADDNATESWSGFHAANTMFVITEATGISEKVFDAIEGNLQGNSRLLIVFNPNISTGYAANAMKSSRFQKFRLNSLNAENVVKKQTVISGQVDYEWVKDKVENWCSQITLHDFNEGEGDFKFENGLYRPNDLFRVKVLGMFPKVSEDVLIPYEWIELANRRYDDLDKKFNQYITLSLGVDVAGMGRDSSVICHRYENVVDKFTAHQSGGVADHMFIAGLVGNELKRSRTYGFIDTIGEGAGVYSRLRELGYLNAISCKVSESGKGYTDITRQYQFANMRAYLHWCVRDWLNPKNNFNACLPKNDKLLQEATEVKWRFQSDGKIIIEPKEDLKKRIGRSPDYFDSLANSFYPVKKPVNLQRLANITR